VAEYEALVLGLRAAKNKGIEEISVFGDANLIFHQVINLYQDKNPRLRSYRNEAWDLIDNFFLPFNISFIPREESIMANSVVVSASNFRVPLPPKLKYDVEVNYKPYIPDNVKHLKVFEDDIEIIIFLNIVNEFYALHIDQYQDSESNPHANVFLNRSANHHIVQLPRNHIPNRLVPLEILFQRNDMALKFKGSDDDVDVSECKNGT
jgi:hypothetical protein